MKINKSQIKRESINVTCTLVAALMSAFGMHYFVTSNNFAPAGLDGVATMIAHLAGVNPAYFILALNLPLLVVAWFVLKRRYVIYTVLFTLISSGAMLIFEAVEMPIFASGEGLMAWRL
jgi:uncharacterized membrane-anchored protein YitT (DUF2179 family)